MSDTVPNPKSSSYPWRRLLFGCLGVIILMILAASLGSVEMSPFTVLKMLLHRVPFIDITPDWPETWETILWQLRLPRIILAGLVGGSLAISGATYQGMFRNPLADPYLIGVASGAGMGAIIVLVSWKSVNLYSINMLPLAAFMGALIAVTAAYFIARNSSELPLTTLILAGVSIATLTSAVTSLIMIRSDPDLRPVLSWLLGGLASTQWKHNMILLPYFIASVGVIVLYGRILNILQLDEEHAAQIGVNVERTKVILLISATLSTAVAVSYCGIIGFVGLVSPHIVRLIWGGDYRFLLPMSVIVGAGFLIISDLVARTIVSPGELPVGIVTAFLGAPFLLYLLRRRNHKTLL